MWSWGAAVRKQRSTAINEHLSVPTRGYLQPGRLLRLFAKGLIWGNIFAVFMGFWGILLLAEIAQAAPCDPKTGDPLITHDLSVSYCELCSYGYVTIVITNPYEGADMTAMTVTENLGSSGLTFYNSPTVPVTYRVNGAGWIIGNDPDVTGANGNTLEWASSHIPALSELEYNSSPWGVSTIEIRYPVSRHSNVGDEGLVGEDLDDILVELTYTASYVEDSTTYYCANGVTVDSGYQILDLREPDPDVEKQGRNADAGQGSGEYSDDVYGNNNDDVIWRIRVRNTGDADLQDLRFDDLMGSGNLDINYICPSESAATDVVNNNGTAPGGSPCEVFTNVEDDYDVDNPFGNPNNDSGDTIDVSQGTSAYIYVVGKVESNASCYTTTTYNTVSDVQWGCEGEGSAGGIPATSSGSSPGTDSTTLSTYSDHATTEPDIEVQYIGINSAAQPAGARGRLRIIIQNQTGGTIKNLHLRDELAPEYVIDTTFPPVVDADGAYGTYAGQANQIENLVLTNPNPSTIAEALANTSVEFDLTHTTPHPDYPAVHENLLRHGDQVTVDFGIVLVRPESYDEEANLDVRTEAPGAAASDSDPDNDLTVNNDLYVEFEDFCNPGVTQQPADYPIATTHPTDPEDLDIDIDGSALIFILTNDPNQELPLTVNLTNNGGHDAEDYSAYVSFGETMIVNTVAPGCSATSNPPPHTVWQDPTGIPATASVYLCTGGAIAPGATVSYDFGVIKNAASSADDLTFRADVIGEIHLYDDTPLWFPDPATNSRGDGVTDTVNNYSIDGLRARVIGFNLTKEQDGTCNENNPPSYDDRPNTGFEEVQIGEECSYHIEAGGWFGFQTPGFTLIAVHTVQVFDEIPDGQGYIVSTDPPDDLSTSGILGVNLNPSGLTAPDEVTTPDYVNWTFNQGTGQEITVKDHWFRADITSRLLNDPIDTRADPNEHANLSTNILNATFQAVFEDTTSTPSLSETYTLDSNTVGYPEEAIRRVDLTVTEPHLTVEKQVCNESLYGVGTDCSTWVDLADDGDAYNDYIYRITVTNEASSDSVTRAPAYDVTVTDTLDASDLAYVYPLSGDSLDNDGDGIADDAGGEGSIGDNVVDNGTPAVITFAYTHSSALERINPGDSVTLYYRVDYDDDAAPLQTFTNTVLATYDSLTGDYGNMSAPQRSNSDIAGARFYTSDSTTAQVQIIPVEAQPKSIAGLSNTPLVGSGTQGVSVGEEIEYRLTTLLPVAQLVDFRIRDELPAGLRCSEAPDVNLDADPYAVAGFDPGGTITPTCADGYVEWLFDDQRLTSGTAGLNNRFEFEIGFIARVENTANTNDGDVLSNGDPATNVYVTYVNELGSTVTYDFGQVDVEVHEPLIELTKSFAVADADAVDVLIVTVTATNNGTATAYNLRVLEDLTGLNLTYVGNVGGSNPPDTVDTTTLGVNSPIFSWSAPNGIDTGDSISFTFEISVDDVVQPLEVLDNTIQADWTSLPGQTTALNSLGTIGADGSDTGMRNGALPNAGDSFNDYETDATAQVAVPALTVTKTDLDMAMVPTIGVHKNFQLDILLPEGVTNVLTVVDALNSGVVSYVLANNGDYDISYTFEGIATINGAAPDEAAFNVFPADATSGSATWDIGTVVTDTEDDLSQNNITPLIRINYFARINNDTDTDDVDTLQNGVTVSHTHGETGATESLTDDTAAVTAVEPLLTVNKAVSNATNPGNPPVGGDQLEYIITIVNTGTSTAYDINIVDPLPTGVAFYSGFTPTSTINSTAVSGFVATPSGAPYGPLNWGRENGDASLDLPVGQTLELTYQILIEEANGAISNSVYVDWTSLDDVSIYERTGDGCPSWTAPNDYCAGPAVATTTTVDDTAFAKEITADSYDVAPLSTAIDAISRVGDTVTYRLALQMRGGLTRDVEVTDVLPTGMAFLETVSINYDTTADYTPPGSGAGSNFSYAAITSANVPTAGQTGTLTWTIGDVDKDPFGDPTTDTLEIIYRAETAPDSGIPHTATTTLDNGATMTYLNGSGLTDSVTLTINQPVINQVTKIDRGGFTSPADVNVANDVMQFRIEACNTGDAPAYSVEVTDQLATQFNETGIANLTVSVGGVILTAGTDYTYIGPAARGGTLHFLLETPVNPGECLVIDYDIGFYTDFPANQTWNNSVTLDRYWSLPSQSGQEYASIGPTIFQMHNIVVSSEPPEKNILLPVSGEAAIGEEIVYQITVPGTPFNAAMYDVVITDTLDPNLEYISASETSANGFTLIDNSVAPTQLSFTIDAIPANEQAVIEVHVRLLNTATANAGGVIANTVLYTYADAPGGAAQGGGTDAADDILINEPSLTLAKSMENVTYPGNAPQAGDILRYTLTVTAAGGASGDNFSDAFDLIIDDSLSLGLAYSGNPTVDGGGNTIAAPVVSGDGINAAQTLAWSPANANADIDISEGTTVSITYEVEVLNEVLVNQTLTNSATVQWTSLDGDSANERNGTETPTWNDYITGPATTSISVDDLTTLDKARLQDSYGSGDADVRIGDIIQYELRLGLQEGSYTGLVVTDILPQGLVFEGIVSVNGDTSSPYAAVAPFTHANIASSGVSVSGDPATGPTTLTWSLGDITNQSDIDPTNDDFVIIYRARVLNEALVQTDSISLTNTATLDHQTATGPAVTQTDGETVTVLQPNLTVSKLALAAGGDTVLAADEIVTYTVDIENTGTAPAYDGVVADTIPAGMRNGSATVTMVSMELLSGTTLTALAPTYDASTGVATWDLDSGVADAYTIPAGDTLRIVYEVQADNTIGTGLTLTNAALVQVYYSLDDEDVPTEGGVTGVREIYGPSNTASVTLTTAGPEPLDKESPTPATAAVGEPFSYTITVPATPLSTALYDVRILDDLSASVADMTFVSVTKISIPGSWTPVNTGSATDLVIEDTTTGIDIPAGEQIVIEIEVVLEDTAGNTIGLTFDNLADYTYNQVDNDATTESPGGSDTATMTIVGPDNLTVQKDGPATMSVGTPATFTLDLHNASTGASAWQPTLTDQLPDEPTGGMCGAGPSNVTARIFQSDGTTPVSPVLVESTDFAVTFNPAPACTWTFHLLSAPGGVEEDQRLIVNYDLELDADTENATSLTNIAGVTQWYSADPDTAPIAPHAYTEVLTDGTVGTLDHEDAHTITTEAPILTFEKSVVNVTTSQDPGANASPGDVLEYTIQVTNNGPVGLTDFTIEDEVDRLNDPAVFAADTLSLVSYPAGANVSGTDATGGTHGTGLVSVAGLSIGAAGSGNDSLTVVFQITLADVIASGTLVLNQAELNYGTADPLMSSDDPNIGGTSDPTETLITSAPQFQVEKISSDLTGDPDLLLAGDTLRYTITVKNIGDENAVNVTLQDNTPANTTYVSNSTTLNGVAVADASGGVNPLISGILVNAPENTTPGFMRADTSATADNVATVTFDVVVDTDALDGTIIENQGFVNGDGEGSGMQPDQPSDDPDTPTVDDPTRDVVGSLPLLYALKTVEISVDNDSDGIVDPDDVLRYTIVITNTGAVAANNVILTDSLPNDTTYVVNSTILNGSAVADSGGTSQLTTGLVVQSSDNPGAGIISIGGNAEVTFEARVNIGTPDGTLISNQGSVTCNELSELLTDSDGVASNGYQPTVIVVGNTQLLSITKEVTVTGGGPAEPGSELTYVVRIANIGSVAATDVLVTDDLTSLAGQVAYVAGSGTMNGITTGVTYTGSVLTADYAGTYGDLAPGNTLVVRFRVVIDNGLAYGTTITNTAEVTWDSGSRNDSASVSIDVGGTPGSGALNGSVWHDSSLDTLYDTSTEAGQQSWTVELYLDGSLVTTTTTDDEGNYQLAGLAANDGTGSLYEIRFVAPGAGANTASMGDAVSVFTNGPQNISAITVAEGENLQNLNLPLWPNGTVYESINREPVTGATLELLNAGSGALLPASCFNDPLQQGQVTTANGFYKFDLNFSVAACPAGGDYLIQITQPASGFLAAPSTIINPASDASTPAYSVPICSNDAIPATTDYCEAVTYATAPPLSVAPNSAGTTYYLHLTLNDSDVPGSSQMFNNPIPIDSELDGAVAITKVAALTNVSKGSLVPYTITVTNIYGVSLEDMRVVDRFPAGFKYVEGSSRLDGEAAEPDINGRELVWDGLELAVNEKRTFQFILIVGSGVSEGEYVNRARVFNTALGTDVSGEATATVRVVPDPDFDCTDVIGKVFDDSDLDGWQDKGEAGLSGVRLVTARGLIATTDEYGRFHISCAVVPDEDRGSNFILKLDERSLPGGFRLTTENPRVQRATRGKMLRFNFGATIHRVVRIDLADGAYEPDSNKLRLQWQPKIAQLIKELKRAPSVLHLSYLADLEKKGLVKDRLKKLKKTVAREWERSGGNYRLVIETETFWRRGAPVKGR